MQTSSRHTSLKMNRVGVCMVLAAVVAAIYVSLEHAPYVWDYGLYWEKYNSLGQTFTESLSSGFLRLRLEIAAQSYNSSSLLLLTPVYFLFGGDRIFYVAAIASFYLVPVIFIATRLARHGIMDDRGAYTATLFAAFLYPAFWAPTLHGMVDVCGLIPLGLATLAACKTEGLTKANWRHALGFGFLLWCAFLLRRWYAFAIVALVATALAFVLAREGRRWRSIRDTADKAIFNYAIAGLSAIAAATTFQPQLINRIIYTNYADEYSGYQTSLSTQLQIYYDNLGFWVLLVATAGLVADLAQRRTQSFFCACAAVLTALLFARIQAPSAHHILPVAFFLFPAYAFGLSFLAKKIGPPRLAAGALGVMVSLNFLSTFTPVGWEVAEPLRAAFPSARHAPLRFAHYDDYVRMVEDLNKLEPDTTLSIFASSPTMADSVLIALDPALERRIILVSQVDRRDGFNWMALAADYVIICTPTVIHLNLESQRVIAFPAEAIRAGVGVGAAFADTGLNYQLEEGVTAHLYKRARPVSADEIRALAERFYEAYPDWRAQRPDVGFGLASADIRPGDSTGKVIQANLEAMGVQPGKTTPTTVTFRLDDWFRPRRLKVAILNDDLHPCPAGERLHFASSSNRGATSSGLAIVGQSRTVEIPDGDQFQIVISPPRHPYCGHALLSFDFGKGEN